MKQYNTVVSKKEMWRDDLVMLSLVRPEGFEFEAGQFLNLAVEIDGNTQYRAYSILSPPKNKETIDLIIKLFDESKSSQFISELKVGSNISFKGPMGRFNFGFEQTEEYWLVATGTGVAPFYSMLKEHINNIKQQVYLVFSVRTQADIFLLEEFKEIEDKYSNFHFMPTLTRDEWEGLQGRPQKHLPVNIAGKMFYVCGLKELVLDTEELLQGRGARPEQIRKERYS